MRASCVLAIALASCSSSARPEPASEPQPAATPRALSGGDAVVVEVRPDGASPGAVGPDRKHPRIFPWESLRERNEKWLSNPSDDHCDPRNRHLRRKGESECYPPSNVQLAATITRAARAKHDQSRTSLTVDRGYSASVTSDYFISLLDADGRPATPWVHPSRVERDFSEFELPIHTDVPVERGITRAAIVEKLTTEDRFPDSDSRSQP